jgi:hypothetical protein
MLAPMRHGPVKRFSIDFDSDDNSSEVARGRLVLGMFEESFEASLRTWSRGDYSRHWREAIAKIVGGSDRSALVTDMYEPATANFIRWWPMYRLGDVVRFHNQLLFLAQLAEPFTIDNMFGSVPEYSATSDGHLISEWSVDISAVEQFLAAGAA